nr:RDD family protein [Trichlorobacter sp.]
MLLAGPTSRLLALLVDFACISVASTTISTVLRLFTLISQDIFMALTILSGFVISIGYGIGCEWYWQGQTVGKRLLHLRVMDEQGLKLQFSQVVIRNLLRIVDSLPALYLVGGIASLISRKCQRLGDLAAGTIVIRTPKVQLPDLEQLGTEKFNSLAAYPQLVARLRQKVSREEGAIALRALIRREELDPTARLELFRELAVMFRSQVAFPAEAVDGVSDERYVRNVVELLFEQRGR